MSRDWRRTLALVVLLAAGLAWPAGVGAADMRRVRSSSPVVRSIIDDATAGSATFRTIVTAIGTTDGIVYVEQGVCGHGVRACLSLAVTRSAGFRFLRILIDLKGATTFKGRVELIGTIGHELWHALEVLLERALTTTAAVFQFYAREAPTGNRSFETQAAIAVGNTIRREMRKGVTLVGQQAWRDRCAGPETTLGTDGWWAWPCI